jgi:hypothetical protein
MLLELILGLAVLVFLAAVASRRDLRKKAAFAALPLLALLGLGELGTRATAPESGLQAGGPLGWTARPHLEGLLVARGQGSFEVSTNADGLRTELARERGDRARWVTFGDSTVFGWGVAAEHSPAGTLEALVPGVEVLNAGQPGYSSEQARRLAERVLPAYRPDRVIWFHPWHDVAGGTPDRELLPAEPGPLGRLLRRSALLGRLRPATPAGNELFVFEADRSGDSQRVPEAHRRDNLDRLGRACAQIDAELVLVLLPVDGGGRSGGLSQELTQAAERLGAVFVDLNAAPSPRPWLEITVEGDPGHLDAEGNRIYMQELLRALDASG